MMPITWKILITGVTSIHGWPIYKLLKKHLPQDNIIALRSPKMKIPDDKNVYSFCITDRTSLFSLKNNFHPTHVIHGAGVCDLDVCEQRPLWAHNINVNGAKTVADIFGNSAYMMHLSSDLVFSGKNPPPGGYDEKNDPDPLSVAGKTILLAEKEFQACKNYSIIRLGLPMGDSITGNKGIFDWPKSRFRKSLPVTLFHDEIRSCIDCDELALKVIRLLKLEANGIFHLGGRKPLSLYEVGKRIIKKYNFDSSLLKTISRLDEKNGPPRVGNISLNSQKLTNFLEHR